MGIFRNREPQRVPPLRGLWDAVFHDAREAIGTALDVMLLDTAYSYSDNQKLDIAARDPLMWRGLLGRWGRATDMNTPYNARHAKKGRRS